ncbi:MAG: SAM-dependent methyltransferase [Myxococcota bacterium]|jgi:SAM-dependent methyltransferase
MPHDAHAALLIPNNAPRSGGIVDLCPELPPASGLSQRLMEAPGVGALYEGGIRPLLTALVRGPTYSEEEAWLEAHLSPQPGPILDLACGTGRYTRQLARRHGAGRLIGADVSLPMLRRAATQSPEICFVRASAQALPLATDSLGGACCMGALHLFPDPVGALAELGRVLSPGAPLVLLTAARPEQPGLARGLAVIGRLIRLRFLDEAMLSEGLAAGNLHLLARQDHGAMRLLAARAG